MGMISWDRAWSLGMIAFLRGVRNSCASFCFTIRMSNVQSHELGKGIQTRDVTIYNLSLPRELLMVLGPWCLIQSSSLLLCCR
ncbi:hypothetical protein B0T10DRAFT_493156 [Thelonectria olida]|uniref:Secreted protein n=1 Tax=Thelonectria olida TaxID=1576542 RepID=A0A9P8VXR6_9HYPO|nr:hypothetical protein B0T10DRAFT_493156 [Thelonectria olida]